MINAIKNYFYTNYDTSPENVTRNMHRLYGFPEPANEHMTSIIDMYHNTCICLSWILIAILWLILVEIIPEFHAKRHKYPSYFTRWQESLIDSVVVFIPLIVILYLVIPTVGYVLHTDRLLQYLTSNISIEIVGHQWYWTYWCDSVSNSFLFNFICVTELENTINMLKLYNPSISSDLYVDDSIYQFEFDQLMDLEAKGPYKYLAVTKTLVLPVNEYIRCLVTSDDVIHSFALPQLGVKVDAIPGRMQAFILHASKTGVYFGQCSELCGVNHAFMPICIEFACEEQFYDWYIKNLEVRPYKLLLSLINLN